MTLSTIKSNSISLKTADSCHTKFPTKRRHIYEELEEGALLQVYFYELDTI